ncbi:Cys-tRNA(Pro) deacylase [Bifidobacterium sp.]|uniref:Cys-tRNA(Pro) deacylase n=1 Tax=Bifidobacterium sp. TaxID=41200 RepID=UPI0025C4BF29|nr:Cys-tRNA(Pro) deacylase [Bifidobacterium sp.]MCH4209321.1 Cys-tRNA(Pro) deacylase [Bifidobacterium sp.]MCI1224115.1 Cys-tRNA(Pro) deacylase [Bifidobacterium sp.]
MSKRNRHGAGSGSRVKASTPAIAQLRKTGITFETYEYEHSADHMDDGYGIEAAQRLGLDPHQIFKTLMADTGSERVIGIVPVSGHLDLKALAAAAGAKKVAMASHDVAQRESGYVLGGISPFGQRTRHRTVLDDSALRFETILVSGGKRGLDVGIKPTDLLAVLHATAASIATW